MKTFDFFPTNVKMNISRGQRNSLQKQTANFKSDLGGLISILTIVVIFSMSLSLFVRIARGEQDRILKQQDVKMNDYLNLTEQNIRPFFHIYERHFEEVDPEFKKWKEEVGLIANGNGFDIRKMSKFGKFEAYLFKRDKDQAANEETHF